MLREKRKGKENIYKLLEGILSDPSPKAASGASAGGAHGGDGGVISHLGKMGYQVHLTRDDYAYVARILRDGRVVAAIKTPTADEAFGLLEKFANELQQRDLKEVDNEH
jgi:hypothetical protein